ncbi:MAG: HNH endonuclease [Gemmatimonadaceae bacterium]|nr:HNH endonuclease [Gemmatimonadaceae bacterium]
MSPRTKPRQRRSPSEESRRRRAARQKVRTDAQRFWAKVQVPPEGDDVSCWPWTAAVNAKGYGVFFFGSRLDGSRRTVLAHRFAWELVNGPLPDGIVLLHSCDTPACVRHGIPGTQADNVADMIAKGRNVLPPGRRVAA